MFASEKFPYQYLNEECLPFGGFQEMISQWLRVGAGEPDSWLGIQPGCDLEQLNSFDPQFLHLKYRDYKHTHLPRLKISEMMRVKGSAHLLTEGKLNGNL